MEKTCRDGGVFGALLTDLSIVFDCNQHEFIIAKLKACGFHSDTLKLIHDYLPNTQQRVKANDGYSLWKKYFMVFHRNPQCALGNLIYCYVTQFTFWRNYTLQAMWMLLEFIPLMKLKSQSMVYQKRLHKCSLDDLLTTL